MHIALINTFDDLDALREDWRRLHAADSHATVFTSWPWLRAWANVSPYPWAVLVAREDQRGPVTGLFPISPRGSTAPLRLDQLREIHTMGDEAADYRGLICDPEREDAVIEAFADYLAVDAVWDRIVLKDMLDARLPRLVARVAEQATSVTLNQSRGNACPLLALPVTWDAYVENTLTPPSRKSLKKRLRIAEGAGARLSVVTGADDDRAAHHLSALLRVAALRGKSSPPHLQRCRAVFESCLREGAAEISVLLVGEEPAAAQGSFVDHRQQSIGHYLTGFDDRFAELSPGRVLDALCIRRAIERGWALVDFLRGDEPYKHQLGARPRHTQNVFITRSNVASHVRSTISRLRDRVGL